MSKVIDNIEDIASIDNHIGLSGITAYHLLQGNLAVDNTVTTQGFNTTLYTGNGSTQSINTGIDMATTWGNDTSEQFGGLVWVKSRSIVANNALIDTVRGTGIALYSNLTNAQASNSTLFTGFSTTGFSLSGTNETYNQSSATYASWNFQTTHRVSGTTNHGKAYTCHFNPFTGFTMVKYEGSGIAGHEIPHHLGRKLGFAITKNLTVADGFGVVTDSIKNGSLLFLHSTSAIFTSSDFTDNPSINENCYTTGYSQISNKVGSQHILYGWANSYFDESNKLIGNYEIGTYQGTGASGNKVVTRGKPAWLMVKRIDSTGNWVITDNKRNEQSSTTNDGYLYANLSNAEGVGSAITYTTDGFIYQDTGSDTNVSGSQYLYIVAYDTNSNGGGSYYPRATDTSNLQVQNAIIPFANGVDGNGSKITTLSKNETISGLTLTAGKNYVYSKNDGTYGVSKFAPQYNTYNGFGDYYDVVSNKWYSGLSVYSNDGTTTAGLIGGAVITVENGRLKFSAPNGNDWEYIPFNTIIGKKYKVIFEFGKGTSDTNILYALSNVSGYGAQYASGTSQVGINTLTFVADTLIASLNLYASVAGTRYYDNIAIYPINDDGTPDLTNATVIPESRNYLNHIVYADNDGSPLYVEELPKVEYKDVIKANEYRGKNACTAWVNFDGTTIPPTIRDSYNVSSVVRTATGQYDVYFATPMDNVNYSISGSVGYLDGGNIGRVSSSITNKFINKVTFLTFHCVEGTMSDYSYRNSVQIFGGKN